MEVGIYFYSHATNITASAKEAAWVVQQIAPYRGRILYPIAYDLEDSGLVGLGRNVLTDMVKAFCTTIEAAGYYASLYCNTNWCKNLLNMADLQDFVLWLAQWGSEPPTAYSYGMWQRTANGWVNGVNTYVDMDIAYKDYAAIIKSARMNGYKRIIRSPKRSPQRPHSPWKRHLRPAFGRRSFKRQLANWGRASRPATTSISNGITQRC